MTEESISPNNTDTSESDCPKGVKSIQNIYLALISIFPFIILLNVLFHWNITSYFLEGLVTYLVFLGIYYGISRVKSWVVIFIQLIAYMGACRSILGLLEQHHEISKLVSARTFSALFLCFFAYQIIVFSKKETKEYFKVKGKVIV